MKEEMHSPLRKLGVRNSTLSWLLGLNLVGIIMVVLLLLDARQVKEFIDPYEEAKSKWGKLVLNQKFSQSLQIDAAIEPNRKKPPAPYIHEETGGLDLSVFNLKEPLDFIPPVPRVSDSDIVPNLSERIMKENLKLYRKVYKDKIVILTPVYNVVSHLGTYANQLHELTYPHDLISVVFGEDNSDDRTFEMAKLIADDLKEKHGFRNASAVHFNISGGVHDDWRGVHERSMQFKRRSHLAKARNLLLKAGLKDEQWVLWIDSDISELPKDLVEQLLYAKGDVVAPSCLFKSGSYKRIYDKNTWRETPMSLEDQEHMEPNVLLVEGYGATYRLYLPNLRAEGRVVPLDGVGGCALLVRAQCHRKGLKFPETVYEHHIETEGLAKMAKNMKFKVHGLPFVEVFH